MGIMGDGPDGRKGTASGIHGHGKDDWMTVLLSDDVTVMLSGRQSINKRKYKKQLKWIRVSPNRSIMGLLSLGTPFDWDQAKHFAEHVRSHGTTQFLNTWDRLKDRFGDELLWGDEVLR